MIADDGVVIKFIIGYADERVRWDNDAVIIIIDRIPNECIIWSSYEINSGLKIIYKGIIINSIWLV